MISSESHLRLQPPPPPAVFRSTAAIYATAAKRCFSVSELIYLLSHTTPLRITCGPPSSPPPSGSLFLYDRSTNRHFKQDGHDWVKKRVSLKSTTLKVREDDVKLRLNGEFRVAGWYARLSTKKTFRRRTYYLLNPEDTKVLNDLVLVHYLDTDEASKRNVKEPVFASTAADGYKRGGKANALLSDLVSGVELKAAAGIHDGDLLSSYCGNQIIGQKSCAPIDSAPSNQKENDISNKLLSAQVLQGSAHGDERNVSGANAALSCYNSGQPQGFSYGNSAVASEADFGEGCRVWGGNTSSREIITANGSSPPTKTYSPLSDFQNYPKLSEQDVAMEWASSNEKEKCAAIADLYGSEFVNDEQPSFNCIDTNNRFAASLSREIELVRVSMLEGAIEKIHPEQKSSYLEAMRRCPSLALSHDIKLQFLRCEDDIPSAAARRLVDYWAMRVELFGIDHAFSPLTLEGAFSDEWEKTNFGFARLLPGTDASGRAIVFTDNAIRGGGMADLRSLWYMVHAVLEDQCTKRNGVVYIHFNTPSVQHADRNTQLQFIRLANLVPVRLRAIHVCRCVEQSWFRPVSDAVKASLGKNFRARRVLHEGSVEVLISRLAEFGISRNQLPAQMGGDWTEESFQQWLELRRSAGR